MIHSALKYMGEVNVAASLVGRGVTRQSFDTPVGQHWYACNIRHRAVKRDIFLHKGLCASRKNNPFLDNLGGGGQRIMAL